MAPKCGGSIVSVWNHGWSGCSSLTVDTYATVEKETIQVHRGDQVMAVKSSSDIREISWVDGSMLLFLGKGSMLYGFSLDGNQGVVDVKDYERSEVHLNEGCVLLVKDKDADTVIRPKDGEWKCEFGGCSAFTVSREA